MKKEDLIKLIQDTVPDGKEVWLPDYDNSCADPVHRISTARVHRGKLWFGDCWLMDMGRGGKLVYILD